VDRRVRAALLLRRRPPRSAPLALAAAALGLAAAACRGEPAPPAPTSAATARLAVLAPAAAETIDRLGAAGEVVGVGDFVVWPPALAARPKLGSYDAPSAERLLALGANLVVTTAGVAGHAERQRLRGLGIDVLELETATYAGALASIVEVGERIGRGAAARALAEAVDAEVRRVAARTAPLGRRRVLIAVGREPLFVAGPGSHLDRLLEAAGGANVVADVEAPYAQVSVEAVVARLPEAIVDMSDNRPGAARGALAGSWGSFPFLPAVAGGRVWSVDPARVAIPGPRMGETAALLARMVHPESLGAPSPAELGALVSGPGPP
jgi:iron complex transport system substrate-binding protein